MIGKAIPKALALPFERARRQLAAANARVDVQSFMAFAARHVQPRLIDGPSFRHAAETYVAAAAKDAVQDLSVNRDALNRNVRWARLLRFAEAGSWATAAGSAVTAGAVAALLAHNAHVFTPGFRVVGECYAVATLVAAALAMALHVPAKRMLTKAVGVAADSLGLTGGARTAFSDSVSREIDGRRLHDAGVIALNMCVAPATFPAMLLLDAVVNRSSPSVNDAVDHCVIWTNAESA